MIILGFKTLKLDKKQNSLLLAYIMHIAHFLNLYGADMRLISCRWVTYTRYTMPNYDLLTGNVLLKNSSMLHDMTYGKHANIIFTNLHRLVVTVVSVVFIKLSNLKHEGDRTKYGLI